MKIVTWNINSIRIRLELLKELSENYTPDIICLQEIKVENHLFPVEIIKSYGYEYLAYHGQKSYNGVCIISKFPFKVMDNLYFCGTRATRHIHILLETGLNIHNFYIPSGGEVPDVDLNPKFKEKLLYLDEMQKWLKKNIKGQAIICGDFNIAPLENDVWSHKQLLKEISHTEVEINKLLSIQNDLNWIDAARFFISPQEKSYSWWSYRNPNWQKNNKGRRLDHIWLTPDLKGQLESYSVLDDFRKMKSPSDHVPLMVKLKH